MGGKGKPAAGSGRAAAFFGWEDGMSRSLRKSLACGVSTIALSLGLASPGLANPVLPNLSNQNFTQLSGTPKCSFSSCGLVGWTGGSGLIFVDSQTPGGSAAGPTYLQTYGNPSGSVTGNYVEADGNPYYESGFNYLVTGLTVGQTYTLSFYQGASQQTGFNGATTNRWIVALGTQGSTLFSAKSSAPNTPDSSCGTSCVYTDSDPTASVAASTLMNVPSHGVVGWNYVSVNLTADATKDLLSFLAWGDNGNTTNLPPIAFLSGVDSPPGEGATTPLPATLPLFGVGLAGVGGLLRRRRRKLATAN